MDYSNQTIIKDIARLCWDMPFDLMSHLILKKLSRNDMASIIEYFITKDNR
jgi:hypothetical protein